MIKGFAMDDERLKQGISAFGGISPTYRIALEKDSPVIVWDLDVLFLYAYR